MNERQRDSPGQVRPLAERARRELLLLRWSKTQWRKSRPMRVARAYAVGVALSYAVAILLASRRDGAPVYQALILQGVEALSWIVGVLAAWAMTREWTRGTGQDAVVALARQRGFSPKAIARARLLSAARRCAWLLGLPALVLALLSVGRGSWAALAPWGARLSIGILVYAVLFGSVLALLVRLAVRASPTRARTWLVLVVVGPLLLAQCWPELPTVPGAFSWLLARVAALGALGT